MKKIPLNSKILSISHNDEDGTVSGIVLGNVFKNITYINQPFYRIDECIQAVNFDLYDYVILTDISPSNENLLDLSDKIVLLDHHESALSYHNPKKNRFVITDICAAKLTKRFIEKMYNIKLSHLDDLIYLTNDYDMWIHEDPRSRDLNDVMFYMYKYAKFRELFMDGRTTLNDEEKLFLEKRTEKFKEIYEKLDVYEINSIHGCLIQEKNYINELAEKLMKEEGYELVIIRNPNHGRLYVRHIIDGFDVGGILKKHELGGGHPKSAGAFIPPDKNVFDIVKIIEKEVLDFLKNKEQK